MQLHFYLEARRIRSYTSASKSVEAECQKCLRSTFISKFHKRNMESFSLCNVDETHEAWKPLLNTLHAFGGSSECFAQ